MLSIQYAHLAVNAYKIGRFIVETKLVRFGFV